MPGTRIHSCTAFIRSVVLYLLRVSSPFLLPRATKFPASFMFVLLYPNIFGELKVTSDRERDGYEPRTGQNGIRNHGSNNGHSHTFYPQCSSRHLHFFCQECFSAILIRTASPSLSFHLFSNDNYDNSPCFLAPSMIDNPNRLPDAGCVLNLRRRKNELHRHPASATVPKGPSIKDVRKNFGILDPSLPLSPFWCDL